MQDNINKNGIFKFYILKNEKSFLYVNKGNIII